MHRYRFLLWRPLQLLPVLLGISILTFIMVRAIPGDPARILLGVRSSPEAIAAGSKSSLTTITTGLQPKPENPDDRCWAKL